MAKKNVSARVPPEIADGVDDYAEAWNMNRTDAMTVLLSAALEVDPDPRSSLSNDSGHTYTLALDADTADFLSEVARDTELTPPEYIRRLIEEQRADLETQDDK